MVDPLDLDAFEEEAIAGEYAPLPFRRGGVDYSLPHPSLLDVDDLFELDRLVKAADSDMESFHQLREFLAVQAGDGGDAVREMKPLILWRLISAWQEQMQTWADDAGPDGEPEGKGPSTSSGPNRAARRSKPTSRSGASGSGKPRSAKSKAASGAS